MLQHIADINVIYNIHAYKTKYQNINGEYIKLLFANNNFLALTIV